MSQFENIERLFHNLGPEFLKELRERSVIQSFEAKSEILREGQNVKFIPIVMSGLVKVFTMNDHRELLYYFLKTDQSCIMTFSTIFKDGISKVFAVADEPSEILFVPAQQLLKWIIKYPGINDFFYKSYELRYTEMMDMVNKVVFHRLDRRVMDYLLQKIEITGKNPVKISHKDIANNLGTAREVVSRILKKFELEGNIRQNTFGIEVISPL